MLLRTPPQYPLGHALVLLLIFAGKKHPQPPLFLSHVSSVLVLHPKHIDNLCSANASISSLGNIRFLNPSYISFICFGSISYSHSLFLCNLPSIWSIFLILKEFTKIKYLNRFKLSLLHCFH